MKLPPARTTLVCLLMVAGSVAWRRGTLFSGSFDVVVAVKAALSVAALLGVLLTGRRRAGTRRVGTGSLWLLALLLASSTLGALTSGTLLASGVVAIRVVVLAATVTLLLRTAPALEVLGGLVWACGLVAAVAAVTGLARNGGGGRLFGGLPPLNPNELGLLAGVVVLWCAWRAVLDEARWSAAAAALAASAVVYLTGSRTALLLLVAAVAVMALHLRRARVGLVVGAFVAAAVAVVGAAVTGAVTGFLSRGGVGDSTLESRFIAWDAAASWAQSGWQQAFGGGLSVKKIPVAGQYWNDQLLDSSWVSALVQAGLVGALVAVVWVVWSFRGALRAPRPHRVLCLGLLVFVVGRSVLESGLFDATPAFLVFLAVSALAEGGSRRRIAEELVDDDATAPAAGLTPSR